MIEPADIVRVLRASRLPSGSEDALQIRLAEVLLLADIPFEREARLSATSRIDFLAAGSIGIEAKVRYPKRSIWRQLDRYAAHEAITALILVTGTAMGLPPTLRGKPIFYVSLGRGCL